jgi:gamma-glutamyltranspeptidase/glutathione hydrolase
MKGVIAAGDPQTAAAGKEILELGGNVVDAAVAAVFASFVAESVMTNIGGGGLALLVDRESPQGVVYDFYVNMPSGQVTPEMDFHEIVSDYGHKFRCISAEPAQPSLGLCRAFAHC